jgi:hypothetical protein
MFIRMCKISMDTPLSEASIAKVACIELLAV